MLNSESLSAFLELSDPEIKQGQELLIKFRENPPSQISIQKDFNLILFIKFAFYFPELDKFFNEPELDPVFEVIWQKCSNSEKGHLYETQRAISCFNLVKSIYLFWRYEQLNPEEGKIIQGEIVGLDFLKASAQQGCFKAINMFCHMAITQTSATLNLPDALIFAKKAAQYHWTPGYLLLAKVYINLMIKEQNQGNPYLSEALQALFMAEKLAPYSEAELHNYPQVTDLKVIFGSNAYSSYRPRAEENLFESARGILLNFIKMDSRLKIALLDGACQLAQSEFATLNKKFNFSSEEEVKTSSFSPKR
jgi:hypothetical protein